MQVQNDPERSVNKEDRQPMNTQEQYHNNQPEVVRSDGQTTCNLDKRYVYGEFVQA